MSHAQQSQQPGYETTDTRLTPLFKFTMWLTIGTTLTLFSMYWLLRGLQNIPPIGEREAHPLAMRNDPIPPAPHLEVRPGVYRDWQGMQVDATERQPFTQRMWSDVKVDAQQRIQNYGWVDREAKVVHIPIERALELSLQRGFPTREQPKN